MQMEIEGVALEGKRLAPGGMVQAEIADFDEAFGKDVLEEAAHEFEGSYCAGPLALILVVAVTEADGLIVGMEDSGIGDGDTIEVTREIAERLFT